MELAERMLAAMKLEKLDKDSFAYVDMQGFKTYKNKFICKEFCLVDGEKKIYALVKSPYSFGKLPCNYQQQALWLTKYQHHIDYDSGNVPIVELIQTVYPLIQNKKVIVKGNEKVTWLKNMFRACGEIECVNIDNFDNINIELPIKDRLSDPMCDFHRIAHRFSYGPCAMAHAYRLQDVIDFHCKLQDGDADCERELAYVDQL